MNPRIILLVIGTFATGTSALIVSGILPAIATGLHTTTSVAGLSVTVTAIAYAVSAPLLPVFLARFERRTIMAIALSGFIIGNVGSIVANDLTWFLISRAFVGFAAAAFTPQASAVAIGLADAAHRGRAITLVLLGIAASSALGVPLGTIIGSAYGYRAAFVLVATLGLIALVALIFVPHTPKPTATGFRVQLAPFGNPRVLAIAGTTVLITAGFFTMSIYFAPLFKTTAGLNPTTLAIALAAFGVSGVASLLIGGRFIDRFGGFRVTAVSLVVLLVSTLLLGAMPSLALIIVVIVPWGLFGNISIPAQQFELGQLDRDNPAPVFALNTSAIFIGTAIGGALGASEIRLAPVSDLSLVAAVPVLLALIATIAQVLRMRRDATRANAVGKPTPA
jgi:MFS transporter, DHA1 family, inner membrane transport protein